MCISKKNNDPRSPVKERELRTEFPSSPRSPWAKLLNRQNSKPRLPKKVTPSARVNLNKYWNKFGELMNNQQPLVLNNDLEANKENIAVFPFSNFFLPLPAVKNCNEVEDNMKNILAEKRFEIITNRGNEVDQNIANEIREICLSNNCIFCR